MSTVLRYAGKRIKKLHKWEPDIGTQQWAEQNVYMHSDSSPLTGMLRFDDTPHLIEVFKDNDRSEVWKQLLNFSTQTGKALCLKTPLLTTMGWTTMGDLKVGDYLFNELGKPCKVTYKSPTYQIDTYDVIFNDGEIIKASKDHIWTVNERNYKGEIETKDFTTLGLINSNLNYSKDRPKFSIPFTKPLEYPTMELPIKPYTLGVWLGDGNSNNCGYTGDEKDQEVAEYVRKDGYRVKILNRDKRRPNVCQFMIDYREKNKCIAGHDVSIEGGRTNGGSCRKCVQLGTSKTRERTLYEVMKRENLLKNKHIPEVYFRSSIEQRIELLQGLMDTDGSISKGVCEFSSSIPTLASNFCVLLDTLGVKYSCREKLTTHKVSYRINFKAYSDLLIPFKMKRKKIQLRPSFCSTPARVRQVKERYIVKIEKVNTVPTQCITVDTPSHLFLAGKGLIATHNTLALSVAWAKAMCTDPARMQWAIKNNKDINDYLEEKILPFVRGVKSLQDKMIVLSEEKKKKQRAASMNVYGGGVTFTGTTDAERRSKTVKYLFLDEIALYDSGHFLELEGRTKAFERHFRKIMAVSSRKRDGDEMDVNYSTCELKKEWHTYCPNCEGYFYAKRKHFKFLTKGEFLAQKGITEDEFNLSQYKKEALKEVYVECPECLYRISNAEKDQNIFDKKYKFVIVDGDEKGKTIGYMVNALAVRITSFETIADLLINAQDIGDTDTLSQLYIDYFNEFYEGETVTVGSSELLTLSNGLGEWQIPKDCYKIYMGVDTQKSNFWVNIQAFCYGSVSHSIWAGQVETFGELEDIWIHGQHLQGEDGESWMISKMGIDRRGYNESGISRTDEVDSFVQYMVSKYKSGDEDRIYATEGHSVLTGDRAVSIVNSRDMSNNRTKVDIKIVKMSNLYLKNVLSRSIQRSLTKATAQEGDEGYDWAANLFFINQDEIERDSISVTSKSYTQQMTAEAYDYARDSKTGKLAKVKSWVRVRKDNHLWDCTVICYAFAEIDKVSLASKALDTDMTKALSGLY